MQLNTLSMVHEFLRRTVKPGDFCIDATAGKGRDTALLCRLTGDAGRVLAFDIQEAAVAQTKALLAAEGLTAEEIVADVTASNQRIAASTGVTPTLIRCPYGEYDDHVISAIRSMGMEPIQWNVEQPEMT